MNTSGPKCPNHCVPLTLTDTRGIGICPVSGCRFSYKADENERKKRFKVDTAGQIIEESDYELIPLDGDRG